MFDQKSSKESSSKVPSTKGGQSAKKPDESTLEAEESISPGEDGCQLPDSESQ